MSKPPPIEVPTWDEWYMAMVYLTAMKSKDQSTKIGAVIVGPDKDIRATGFNGMPRGVDDDVPERYESPEKHFWMEHGERNAIYNAARTVVGGCTMYTQKMPCPDCTKAIIQSGIAEVVLHDADGGPFLDSGDRYERSVQMFREAGVQVDAYSGPVTREIKGLFKGKII